MSVHLYLLRNLILHEKEGRQLGYPLNRAGIVYDYWDGHYKRISLYTYLMACLWRGGGWAVKHQPFPERSCFNSSVPI